MEAARLTAEAREHFLPIASQEGPGRTRQSRIPAEMICSMPTDQGERYDCSYHAYSKLIIQNMISMFIDLEMSAEDNTKMMDCITKHPVNTSTDKGVYSAEECSLKGYKRIILFYYFFNYLSRNEFKDIGQPIMDLIGTMQPRASAQLPLDNALFSQMSEEITTKAKGVKWAYVRVQVDPNTMTILESIVSLGLYCVLTLSIGPHQVIVQGYDATTLHIQNSWGDAVHLIPKKSFPSITVGIENTCTTIETVFPIPDTFELPPLPKVGLTPSDQLIGFLRVYRPLYIASKKFGGKRTKRKRGKRRSKKRRV
jgi:hypothetical protein